MLERQFEILVRSCLKEVFGKDWDLVAQQLTIPSGRIDMLAMDGGKSYHLLELKKGKAKEEAIHQALRYALDLKESFGGAEVVPWVVANEVPERIAELAGRQGVRTMALDAQRCEYLIRRNGLSEQELSGVRRKEGVLHGGSGNGGLQGVVPDEEAYRDMPALVVRILEGFKALPSATVRSGAMQTVLHYRGIKIGGVNRKHRGGVFYISEGIVLRQEHRKILAALGFREMRKTQAGSGHEHIWWESTWENAGGFEKMLGEACRVVDSALGLA